MTSAAGVTNRGDVIDIDAEADGAGWHLRVDPLGAGDDILGPQLSDDRV
jgi:hypothetical protein